MDRAEFMRRLTALLGDVPLAEREEAIQYYNDYFDDAGEENEQGVIASLGSPEDIARSIKAGLLDGGSAGEFTESGFRGYEEQRRNEVMRTQSLDEGRNGQGAETGQQFSGSWNQGSAYGASDNQSNAYGGAWNQGGTYGGANGSGNPYREANSQGNAYGGSSGQGGYAGQQQGSNPPPKQRMSGGMIALIVILAVLSSPVWIGLLGGLFGGSVGLLAGLFGIFLSFLIVGVVLIVVGIVLLVVGIAAMFAAPLGGLCLVGGGMILMAVGLVFLWLMVLVVGTAIPALIRGVVALCRRIFHRGGVRA